MGFHVPLNDISSDSAPVARARVPHQKYARYTGGRKRAWMVVFPMPLAIRFVERSFKSFGGVSPKRKWRLSTAEDAMQASGPFSATQF